ncbi:MAG: hypothetical protein IJF59_06105 [Clostridia bacterium]|nr:hypothetical protein [Clostridia bacterium]MBQ3076318.1 hypothetical protein [Clostridia bacterium]
MAAVTGSVLSRVREGMLNLDVEFHYEAEFDYEVVNRAFFERNMGGAVPAEMLNQTVTSLFRIAFARAYPDGLSPDEMEHPDERLLMQNLKPLVDENWTRFCGVALASFTLRSFRADPAALARIRQIRSLPKTPQQMAQGMLAQMQAAQAAALAAQPVCCSYCNAMVAANGDGRCPACGAPLKTS